MAILVHLSSLVTQKNNEVRGSFWTLKQRRNNRRRVSSSSSSTTTTTSTVPQAASAYISASLSTTTTANQKRVSFSPVVGQVSPSSSDVAVSSASSLSQELDNNELWYSQAEINRRLERDAMILFRMDHSNEGSRQDGTASASAPRNDDDNEDDNDECTRGLESKTIHGAQRSKRTQTSARIAVLEEQHRQRQQLQPHIPMSQDSATTMVPTTMDDSSIKLARVYVLFTRPNQALARQLALCDELYVRDYVRAV